MNQEWIGLIPAAGKGVRLGLPYPKELYPIIRNNRYKPVSQFILDNMVHAGVRHIVFVINETKHQLIGFFGDGHRFGCNISYVVQENLEGDEDAPSTSPGLAHALHSAYHLIRGKTVFFGMADTILQPTNAFRQIVDNSKEELLFGLFTTHNPRKFGMVQMDAARRVEQIIDKPLHTDLKEMWGCMVWQPLFTEFLHHSVVELGEMDFANILNNAIRSGMIMRGVSVENGTYIDLGTYDEIHEMDQHFREE
jgi:dTDP-glucose pyrophosphorylase